MPLNSLIILPTNNATWRMDMQLPFPPFPGLGIRLDVYEMLTVRSVVIGDPGYDVTCIVKFEDTDPGEMTDKKCNALGFEIGPYP